MNKIIKLFLSCVFFLFILSINKYVKANSIDKISMDIYIDNEGNAMVTEIWQCNTNQGTEVYHPYYNLGNSEIVNFKVKDNNVEYNTLDYWNVSGDLESKAYKCGINNIADGVELCWGISNYGNHTYTLTYEITNFVSSLTDSQMVYWTLIPHDFSNKIGNVYIKIYSDFEYPNTLDVWGYGNYGGTCYVANGYIEMQSDGILDKNEYMTILVKFPKDTYKTSNVLNNDFNYYFNMAEEGKIEYKQSRFFDIRVVINFLLIILVFVPIVFIVFLINLSKTKYNIKPIRGDVPYYRDIPCNKNIFTIYYIAKKYNLIKNGTDLFGAIILKWLKDSIIKIEKKEQGIIFKKEDEVIILDKINIEQIQNIKEKELYSMLLEASQDGVLENKEFERWARTKYSKLLSWFDEIINEEERKLIEKGLIIESEEKVLKIFKRKVLTLTENLKLDAENIKKKKKYLDEYTLIKDREAIEVHLFEEYLIFAQIVGIAKKVSKEFKDLYPDTIEQSNFNSYDNLIFVYTCSNNVIEAANSAQIAARNYSAGGGGFSSRGGGSGSFGGGRGGGGFR